MQIVQAPVPPVTGATVEAILAGRLVRPLFQPIVDLSTRTVVGVEALARGPAGSPLEFPDRLFAEARAAGRLGALDMLCSERALEHALAATVTPPLVFVNAEPGVLDQPLTQRLIDLIAPGLPFREIVEFTERALLAVPGSLLRIAGQAQRWGNALALDDVGVDPMSLAFLPVLEPEVIKLDMSLLRHPDSAHTSTVCAVVNAEARRTGAIVIAEGIETEKDLHTAVRLGAHWGQGWHFGRPTPLEQSPHRYDTAAAGALRAPRPDFHEPAGTPFTIAAEHRAADSCGTETVMAALARLRDIAATGDASVVVACPGTGLPGITPALHELAGRAGSVIRLDRPIAGEVAATVIGPGYGHAVCARATSGTVELITLDHLPTVAAITRALLHRQT